MLQTFLLGKGPEEGLGLSEAGLIVIRGIVFLTMGSRAAQSAGKHAHHGHQVQFARVISESAQEVTCMSGEPGHFFWVLTTAVLKRCIPFKDH